MWYNAACGIGYYPYTDYVLYFSGLAVKVLMTNSDLLLHWFVNRFKKIMRDYRLQLFDGCVSPATEKQSVLTLSWADRQLKHRSYENPPASWQQLYGDGVRLRSELCQDHPDHCQHHLFRTYKFRFYVEVITHAAKPTVVVRVVSLPPFVCMFLHDISNDTIRYDIFTCAQKLTKWPA